MRLINRILITSLLVLLTACNSNPSVRDPNSPQTSQPEKGMATVIGNVRSKSNNLPYQYTLVRLAEVFRQGDEGAFVLDQAFSPGARTDDQGHFAFENITPGEYVLVIGDVMAVYKIISESNGEAKVWNVPEDQITDLGELQVDLSP